MDKQIESFIVSYDFTFSICQQENSQSSLIKSDFSATAHRRGSGSLSPRLQAFKRRESIDSIINDEKSHEHEINDIKNLNSKVEDLLGEFFDEISFKNPDPTGNLAF